MFEHLQSNPSLEDAATIDYSAEVMRKMIHLVSLLIPTIYFFISRETALWILLPMMVFSLLVDIGRFTHQGFAGVFYKMFKFMLRKHELDHKSKKFTGATNLLISAVACVLLFPKIIVVNAFAVLIVSDITSALVGRKWGKQRFLKKSLQGSIAFFLSAMIVVAVAPKIRALPLEYGIAVIGALVATIVEASSIYLDDNITVPLSMGATMWGLYWLLLPQVNVYVVR
jgi:dolichol kinase